jgi:26S proteasome regulatory subunit N11
MDRVQRFLGGGGGAQPGMDYRAGDTSEVIHISSLALLKVNLINFVML